MQVRSLRRVSCLSHPFRNIVPAPRLVFSVWAGFRSTPPRPSLVPPFPCPSLNPSSSSFPSSPSLLHLQIRRRRKLRPASSKRGVPETRVRPIPRLSLCLTLLSLESTRRAEPLPSPFRAATTPTSSRKLQLSSSFEIPNPLVLSVSFWAYLSPFLGFLFRRDDRVSPSLSFVSFCFSLLVFRLQFCDDLHDYDSPLSLLSK